MSVISNYGRDAQLAHCRTMQRESERLDNDAGRAFRAYLAARSEGRPANEVAVLKAAYEAVATSCRSFRMTANGGEQRSVVAV